MKNEYLEQYLASVDLSFLGGQNNKIVKELVKDKIIEVKELAEDETAIIKQPENWSKDISELEPYFLKKKLPQQIRLNKYSKIIDVSKFIDSHLVTVKANNGNKTFLPYLNRLKQIKLVV